jgi:hypothetical protein
MGGEIAILDFGEGIEGKRNRTISSDLSATPEKLNLTLCTYFNGEIDLGKLHAGYLLYLLVRLTKDSCRRIQEM